MTFQIVWREGPKMLYVLPKVVGYRFSYASLSRTRYKPTEPVRNAIVFLGHTQIKPAVPLAFLSLKKTQSQTDKNVQVAATRLRSQDRLTCK